MKLDDTSDPQVWNNSLRGNARQVERVQDARRGATLSDPGHDPRQSLPDATEPRIVRNIDLENNLIEAPAAGNYALNVRDYSGQYAAGDLQLKMTSTISCGSRPPVQRLCGRSQRRRRWHIRRYHSSLPRPGEEPTTPNETAAVR